MGKSTQVGNLSDWGQSDIGIDLGKSIQVG